MSKLLMSIIPENESRSRPLHHHQRSTLPSHKPFFFTITHYKSGQDPELEDILSNYKIEKLTNEGSNYNLLNNLNVIKIILFVGK